MRIITHIVIHCTASPQHWGVRELMAEFKAKGWKSPGYHYAILADGTIRQLHPLGLVANGVKGHNQGSIHVAWVGGIDRNGRPVDNRTLPQREALRHIVGVLHSSYPQAAIVGHRDLSPDLNGDGKVTRDEWVKQCPCFEVKEEFKTLSPALPRNGEGA